MLPVKRYCIHKLQSRAIRWCEKSFCNGVSVERIYILHDICIYVTCGIRILSNLVADAYN